MGEDGVAVMIVEDHDVLVAARGLDWEFSCLIGIGFLEVKVRQESGEDDVCVEVVRLLGRADVERLGHGERGLNLRRLNVFLLHAEVAFAGCERFLEMFCDEGCAEAGPGLEVAALGCPQESRR